MNPPNPLKPSHLERVRIRAFDTDAYHKASVQSILRYMNEIAGTHANELKLGYSDLQEKGMFWVLSRIRLGMSEAPSWGEELDFETWPRGIERLFAIRDFQVSRAISAETPESGKGLPTIAKARSLWLLIDAKSKRPLRPEGIRGSLPQNEDRENAYEDLLQIPAMESLPEGYEPCQRTTRRAAYADIDVNLHVNNVRYVEWALDAIPFPLIPKEGFREVTVNYLAEVKPEESVDIIVAKSDRGFLVEGQKSGMPSFRASLEY